jgi:hypothetical protein
MRRRGASPAAIQAALTVENSTRTETPLPAEEVSRIAQSVGRYEPERERRLRMFTVAEMSAELERRGRIEFLIRGLWPADAYGALGAQDKAGKTLCSAGRPSSARRYHGRCSIGAVRSSGPCLSV